MALHIISSLVSKTVPSNYYVPLAVVILLLIILRTISQGRHTKRDRDLHARTIIITGAFTPLGLTTVEHLAKKGAHIIVLLPTPCLTTHQDEVLSLLRSTTSNESIYAEPCPLDSVSSIKNFCEKFVNSHEEKNRRIDALILAHEYQRIGSWKWRVNNPKGLIEEENLLRDQNSMATFLLITLLLPAMLVAPMDRDIRIITLINPFYAAAARQFNPGFLSSSYNPALRKESDKSGRMILPAGILEGQRALRTAVFIRHLQRILDVLPEPGSDSTLSSTLEKGNQKANKARLSKESNIMAVTVSPGISQGDVIEPFFFPPETAYSSFWRRWIGILFYICVSPLLFLLTKGSTGAMQTVLHVLCVPKPFVRQRIPVGEDMRVPKSQSPSIAQETVQTIRSKDEEDEVLVPGALYADCVIIKPGLPNTLTLKGAGSVAIGSDDLGFGDEPVGRKVWEVLEEGVKVWEKAERQQESRAKD